jgi:hypothetical protein
LLVSTAAGALCQSARISIFGHPARAQPLTAHNSDTQLSQTAAIMPAPTGKQGGENPNAENGRQSDAIWHLPW